MTRLAEIATIILCTCFPMMPRLVKLISDRRAKSRSYSKSPPRPVWKRKVAKTDTDETSSRVDSAGSHPAEQTSRLKRPYEQLGDEEYNTSDNSIGTPRTEDIESRLKRPYEQLGDEEYNTSDNSIGTPRTEDIELASWGPFDVRIYGDILEQRLNAGFALPQFSYP